MNIFQLECFLAVAHSLNFARAAKQMNVSQPTITHQIQSLEDELGTKLFYRSTRQVKISPEGESFLTDAKTMVSVARDAKLRLSQSAQKAENSLSIGCASTLSLSLLTDALRTLRMETGELRVQLSAAPPDQLMEGLRSERLQIVFGTADFGSMHDGIRYREILTSEMVCIVDAQHPLAQFDVLHRDQLQAEPLLLCDPMTIAPEMARVQADLAAGHRTADLQICPSASAAYVLARAGFGIALLPDVLVSMGPSLVKLPIADVPPISFGMFTRVNTDPLTRRLLALARAQYEGAES